MTKHFVNHNPLDARMPSINSCRVIFPSWSLSMRLKKSMTRDFLWFIQRMYFFLHTSKSKLANSLSWKSIKQKRISGVRKHVSLKFKNNVESSWKERYLFQSVQTIVEFALAVKSQQPNLLPPGTELVESWVSSRDLHGSLLLLLLLVFTWRGNTELTNPVSWVICFQHMHSCIIKKSGKDNICPLKGKHRWLTGSSPLSQAAGSLCWFSLVGLRHFVDIWLFPRHLLHKHLTTTNTSSE